MFKEKGKLIVIEGSDGSGKETQAKLLHGALLNEGHRVKYLSFPDYKSESSSLIKAYLRGDLGTDAEAINAYAASTFYSVDRIASYLRDWKDFYESGGIVVADRYTTSNFIHQMVKIKELDKQLDYLNWLKDFEYVKMGLPEPDLVLFLDVPPSVSKKLRKNRLNKFTKEQEKDIHESNDSYMKKVYEQALRLQKMEEWIKIQSTKKGDMLPIDLVSEKVLEAVQTHLFK